jgi:hypothetical protein
VPCTAIVAPLVALDGTVGRHESALEGAQKQISEIEFVAGAHPGILREAIPAINVCNQKAPARVLPHCA